MSILFGILKRNREPVQAQELQHLGNATERFGESETYVVSSGWIGMGFQSFHTHQRSRLESQPLVDTHGNMITLDGRIDNHAELQGLLDLRSSQVSDSELVLNAFLHWGQNCFKRLIGDWSVAIWSAAEQVLYIARDHAGTRSLYFKDAGDTLVWSTYLETFFTEGAIHPISETYAARYLGAQPVLDATPYQDIDSVPPSHYLLFEGRTIRKEPHWRWIKCQQLSLGTDADYEDELLRLFKQSVARREDCAFAPIAQLSGGMDSTSIVCMSDHIRRTQNPDAGLIDTLSFYDDSEPSWNEKPYFSAVEARRGKTGLHLETSFSQRTFDPVDPSDGKYLIPGADSSAIAWERRLAACLNEHGFRSILSGVGGDEVMGGASSPYPELADLMVSGKLRDLWSRTIDWCLIDRQSLFEMLIETGKFTSQLYRQHRVLRGVELPQWITPGLRERILQDRALGKLHGANRASARPNAVDNGKTWWSILETLPHLRPASSTRYEYRYPYLDRDLVDFMFSIPRDQVVRPGRRRSLMRRALKDLVPVEVLERRRKAYVSRGPLKSLQDRRINIENLLENPIMADYGFVDPGRLRIAYEAAVEGQDTRQIGLLLRSLSFELWLRSNFTAAYPASLA